MAILTGFPPSNTISPTTYIPTVVERPGQKLKDLPVESRFIHRSGRFMKLGPHPLGYPCSGIRAVCYAHSETCRNGHVYGFADDVEVTWLEDVYNKPHPEPSGDVKCTWKEIKSECID